DGTFARLNLIDAQGQRAAIELPVDCIEQLIMTLPRILGDALRIRFRDNSYLLAFPLGEWRLERAEPGGKLVLTLGTPDGFAVSFSVEPADIERIQEAACKVPAMPVKLH